MKSVGYNRWKKKRTHTRSEALFNRIIKFNFFFSSLFLLLSVLWSFCNNITLEWLLSRLLETLLFCFIYIFFFWLNWMQKRQFDRIILFQWHKCAVAFIHWVWMWVCVSGEANNQHIKMNCMHFTIDAVSIVYYDDIFVVISKVDLDYFEMNKNLWINKMHSTAIQTNPFNCDLNEAKKSIFFLILCLHWIN